MAFGTALNPSNMSSCCPRQNCVKTGEIDTFYCDCDQDLTVAGGSLSFNNKYYEGDRCDMLVYSCEQWYLSLPWSILVRPQIFIAFPYMSFRLFQLLLHEVHVFESSVLDSIKAKAPSITGLFLLNWYHLEIFFFFGICTLCWYIDNNSNDGSSIIYLL